MLISDAQPVQFWPYDEQTSNEKVICGLIKQDCYCQQFNCDDEIRVQIQNAAQLYLKIMDSDGDVLQTRTMTETSDDVWEDSFIPSEEGLCDRQIQLVVAVLAGPVAKSDCLHFHDVDCSVLLEYSNSTNFDNLNYSASPPPTFQLRIPAMFFEEKNPQEQEDLPLSNGVIVTLRSEIQEKTLLDTGYMPNYMHKKLQKVLMHETITIEGTQWKKRDSYDDNPVKKYNLKRASVWLTKYNSVEKNTI